MARIRRRGFEWGYGGSGPAELARAIVADVMHTQDPDQRLYQRFKFEVIAGLAHDWWILPEDQIVKWLAALSGSESVIEAG